MNLVEILGYVAAFLTTLSFLPQAIQTLRTQDTEALSLGMYGIFSFGVFLWLVYGLIINNWPIVVANAITFVLAGLIFVLKLKAVVKAQAGS